MSIHRSGKIFRNLKIYIFLFNNQVKKLTCVVAHLFWQLKLVKTNMNNMAEGLIEHIILELNSTRVTEDNEVEELFNQVFEVASNELI